MFWMAVAWLIKAGLLVSMLPVAAMINAEGLRNLAPVLATKLSKIPLPFFPSLSRYTWTHRLDIAFVMAVFLLIASGYSCIQAMRSLILEELPEQSDVNALMHRRILLGLSWTIVFLDMATFYTGVVYQGWGASFSISSVLLTALYGAVLCFFSFTIVHFERKG